MLQNTKISHYKKVASTSRVQSLLYCIDPSCIPQAGRPSNSSNQIRRCASTSSMQCRFPNHNATHFIKCRRKVSRHLISIRISKQSRLFLLRLSYTVMCNLQHIIPSALGMHGPHFAVYIQTKICKKNQVNATHTNSLHITAAHKIHIFPKLIQPRRTKGVKWSIINHHIIV